MKSIFRQFAFLIGFIFLMWACKPVSQITSGEDAYRYRRYPEATTMLIAEIEKSKDEAVIARKSYWVGESFRLMNDDEASIKWYRQAYELSKNQISLEAYATAVLRNQQYSSAKKLFEKLVDDYGRKEAWDVAIKSCEAAKTWISEQDVDKYVIRKSKINSPFSDYSPTFFKDVLVFTSDRNESKGDAYHWTGVQFTDFYRTREDPKLDQLLFKINGPYNESAIAFNSKYEHVVYTQCGSGESEVAIEYCRLIEARWNDDEQVWTNFRKLPFCKSDVNYGHPTFFNSDKGLIFSSNDGDGIGGYDLYVSYLNNGSWSEPVLLPKGINSSGDEKFPSMKGDSLFYSSDGKIGMGGLDIFLSKFVEPDGWTTPKNLKPPINSGGDDFGLAFDANFIPMNQVVNKFYISSNRKGSRLDDIYIFEEMKLATEVDTTETKESFEIVVEGKILEHIYADPTDVNSRKMGTRPLKAANVHIVDDVTVPKLKVDDNGEFRIVLNTEKQYRFLADKKGYLSNSKSIDVKLTEKDKRLGGKTYIVHIVLDPIVYNKEIVIDDIFYDFDKWNIRDDAKPPLDNLAGLLMDNPSIKIELASHTDCQGLEIYNAELSQRRAQSAVAYLTSLGIEKRRMRAAGYGEKRPAIDCECESCTDEEHQANRRTSFTILKD